MHIFYTPDIENTGYYTLNEEESKHCIRVLRLKKGDPVRLIDGKGTFYEAVVFYPDPRKCSVSIEKVIRDFNKRNFYLHIAIAPTKNIDRFEWFLEKATEIGIDEVTPLICSRSERRNIKVERLEKVIVAAMKQSIIAKKTIIHDLVDFDDFVKTPIDAKKYIAHCIEGNRYNLKENYKAGENAVMLIGPEGDFSPDEIDLAVKNSFLPVTLGNNRLRTETAGIVACGIFNFISNY